MIYRAVCAVVLIASTLSGRAHSATSPPLSVVAGIGFDGSEAARYDDVRDEYIVSSRGAAGEGNDGFISRVRPDGTVIDIKWISGGTKGVTLINPFGIFFSGSLLYVADVTVVRVFNRATGDAVATIPVPGAVRLNDLVVATDGTVYVTDSGSDQRAGAIFRITKRGTVSTFVSRGPTLERPNGIAVTSDGQIVHGGRGVNLVFRDTKGKILREQTLPTGQFDGIVLMPSGDLLVSSQLGKNVYRIAPDGGPISVVAENIEVPAAIGFDVKRMRLLVPQIRAASLSIFQIGS